MSETQWNGVSVSRQSRLNSTAQAEGAEKLIESELAMRGLIAGQYPRNYPGLDLYVFDPARKDRRVDLQVKYRHATDSGYVDFRNRDADFLAVIRGNQGYRYGRRRPESAVDDGYGPREVWIIPMAVACELALSAPAGYLRLRCKSLPDEYLNRFDLVRELLSSGDGAADEKPIG